MKIVVDDLSGPQIAEFLREHIQQMRSITPLESKHALDLDALRTPEVTFWSVMDGDAVVSCGAIKQLDPAHAELKSMRTAPARTRSGIASLLLGHILTEAKRRGFSRLSLETGTAEFFLPARMLYEKLGSDYCEPFAHYKHGSDGSSQTQKDGLTRTHLPDVGRADLGLRFGHCEPLGKRW